MAAKAPAGGEMQNRSKAAVIRCAIYTRKSTEEGLEQDFNTLDAQREAAESFIRSQRHEGWMAVPRLYDDGGCTGANMDRPALKLHAPRANQRVVRHTLEPRRASARRARRSSIRIKHLAALHCHQLLRVIPYIRRPLGDRL